MSKAGRRGTDSNEPCPQKICLVVLNQGWFAIFFSSSLTKKSALFR